MSGGSLTDPALWEEVALALPPEWPSRWRCALSGRPVHSDPAGGLQVKELFGILPVALLLSEPDA
jgi:hypothetical protein